MNSTKSFAAAIILLASSAIATSPASAFQDSGITATIQADSVPTDQPWTQPAKAAFTIDTKGPDSYSVDVAGKVYFPLGNSSVFGLGELVWHRNSQQKKQQNHLQASGGFHFEWDNAPLDPREWDPDRLWSVYADAKLSYSRKAVYADKSKLACVVDSTILTCRTQHVESIRATLDISPHNGRFETDQRKYDIRNLNEDRSKLPGLIYNLGIVGSLFHDSVTENTINPDTGAAITGHVTGGKLSSGFLVTPKWLDYRLNLRLQGQWVHAFSRSLGRREDFDRSTHLLTASLDYDFIHPSVAQGSGLFRPSIGITYTDGSDPLTGRADQSTVVLAFNLAFK
jgi:hypothetical protein